MIEIYEGMCVDEDMVSEEFIRSSGPGGQNVNKVSTAVQLRFHLARCHTLSPEVKKRLKRIGGRRVTKEGDIIIQAGRYRSQEQNRRDAWARLKALFLKAMKKPKKRISTQPSMAAIEKRLKAKRFRKEKKQARSRIDARGDD
ncbi:MAG: alternative ribosome rescue aminoacyl-tRNA hydrolase ArfB [bacterium]